MAFEILCCMKSWDSSVYNHLMPVALHPKVTKLWIVRPRKSEYGEIPKAEYVLTPAGTKFMQWHKIYKACREVARRSNVKAVISFNPIPYGMLAYFASRPTHKPIHLGFIGADWNKYSQGFMGPFLLKHYKQADFITVTGSLMKSQMVKKGLNADNITLLPHSINVDRFPISDPQQAKYNFIFVGELIPRKRVDIILKAFCRVNRKCPQTKLCIVGSGPLEASLKQQAIHLNLTDHVDFIGYTCEVNRYVSQSKIMLIASESEGFPFSLVEGICCGLVSVTTPVGTIRDHIINETNGLFVTPGNADELADKLCRLTEDDKLYKTLRTASLKLRDSFSYASATMVWDEWLKTIH